MSTCHDDLIADSARAYVAHLRGQLATLPLPGRELAEMVIDTTEAALRDRADLQPAEVRSTLQGLVRVAPCPEPWLDSLLNQSVPGLGRAHAPEVVFIGKEAAYDFATPVNYLLESFALPTLWLATGSSAVLPALLGVAKPMPDFLTHPARLPCGTYPAVAASPGHTWQKIAKVLTASGRPATYETWGEQAYVSDLSVRPSRSHRRGLPSPQRVSFLERLAACFADQGTRFLVVHGDGQHLADSQRALARAFLGASVQPRTVSAVDCYEAGSRRVLRCRHLSNSVSDAFLASVGELLR